VIQPDELVGEAHFAVDLATAAQAGRGGGAGAVHA